MSTGFVAACLAKYALECPSELLCVAVACSNLRPPEIVSLTSIQRVKCPKFSRPSHIWLTMLALASDSRHKNFIYQNLHHSTYQIINMKEARTKHASKQQPKTVTVSQHVGYLLHKPGSRHCHLVSGHCTIRPRVFDCKYPELYKKLSYRREAARCLVLLSILVSR